MTKNRRQIRAVSGAKGYHLLQILLHWATALLILLQLVINEDIRAAFRERLAGVGVDLPAGAVLHLLTGLVILGLTVLRLAMRLKRGPVPPPEGGHALLVAAGEWAHRALYALLFFLTLTGAAAWFLASETAAILHEAGRLALVALILLHMLGALVEHFVIGNRVIRRMLPVGGRAVSFGPAPASARPEPEAIGREGRERSP